ncbi:hypothetical protein F0562_003379 [Nyssa sinensis]|uniref:Uncharacterized protein n=1 Tax=Nyssa sinensis TaxID=561372 RepID=A0A5J5BYC8_9ASTE|nr:hypothetical protein F0562_003379 [Nyssa sinensis]
MEVGASSTALLDNSDSISAYASQPEFSTKITDQQESPYTIQPINPMEIGTTSSDPLLDCPAILPHESYQHPSGHLTSMPSNQPPRHNAGEIELWLRANEPCGEPPIWLATRLTTSGDAFGISLMPKVDGGSSPLEFKWVSLVHTAEAGRLMGSPAPIETSTEWTPAALAEDRIAGLKAELVVRVSPCMRKDAAAT